MQTLSQLRSRFLSYMKEYPFDKHPTELYEPVDYILQLGGKRLRPLLVLMSCNLFQDSVEEGLPIAYAVEIFHNFSLVHDDIMDAAPLRRGKPTVHHRYDVNTGILSGDAMLIYTYDYLMRLEQHPNLIPILKSFTQVGIAVCEGQQYDMNFEVRQDVRLEEYMKMIELKTAVLLAAAMKMGALVAGASTEDVEHAYEFGRNIGIAFQLQDDILDTFGDPEKFGKKVGGDIVQNKKTFLMLRTLELADAATKKQLEMYLTTPTLEEQTKIKAVKDIFEQVGVLELAQEIKMRYQQKAFEHIDAIKVTKERKMVLRNLAEELLKREV